VAHNPESASYLANKLTQERVTGRRLVVFSMLADKDCNTVIHTLKNCFDAWYIAGIDVERGQSLQQLSSLLKQHDIQNIVESNTLEGAYRAALEIAKPDDVIVVCGSFYTVGAVLPLVVQAG
jgi:dihydrofolate synthase/folylpolyglutamate synthase